MTIANAAGFPVSALSGSRRRLPFGRGRKPDPVEGVAAGFAGDLERLALTSPHLLADMGFEIDGRAGSPTRTVWRRAGLCVTIDRGQGPAAVRVASGG